MRKPLNISMFISSLTCGGAERVACILARGLAQRGHRVCFLLWGSGEEPFYPLPSSIAVRALGLDSRTENIRQSLSLNVRRMSAIGSALRRQEPDLLISHMTHGNCLALMATRILRLSRARIIVCEHNNPLQQGHSAIWRVARRTLYPLADAVVPCGRGVGTWFESWLPNPQVVPIPNPVVLADREADPGANAQARRMVGARWVLAMGRLVKQKGYDSLLRAFARAHGQARDKWRLGIIGEGPLRGEIQNQIAHLGLGDSVHLMGTYANPLPVLMAGDIFALSSRYEGFPVSLLEAMACGLAPVAFDCHYGPGEIIRNGQNGILVPPGDEDALAVGLRGLMCDQRERARLASRAREVTDRYSKSAYLDRWVALFDSLLGLAGDV